MITHVFICDNPSHMEVRLRFHCRLVLRNRRLLQQARKDVEIQKTVDALRSDKIVAQGDKLFILSDDAEVVDILRCVAEQENDPLLLYSQLDDQKNLIRTAFSVLHQWPEHRTCLFPVDGKIDIATPVPQLDADHVQARQ